MSDSFNYEHGTLSLSEITTHLSSYLEFVVLEKYESINQDRENYAYINRVSDIGNINLSIINVKKNTLYYLLSEKDVNLFYQLISLNNLISDLLKLNMNINNIGLCTVPFMPENIINNINNSLTNQKKINVGGFQIGSKNFIVDICMPHTDNPKFLLLVQLPCIKTGVIVGNNLNDCYNSMLKEFKNYLISMIGDIEINNKNINHIKSLLEMVAM